MQNFKEKKTYSDDTKAKEYIYKYIKELQRHFDIPDRKMRSILLKVYGDLSSFSRIKNFIKKSVKKIPVMLKSLYIQKKKRRFIRKTNGT